ncbi:MAG: amidophosphoribosyltransferase, partial [Planctomycetota bacterium]
MASKREFIATDRTVDEIAKSLGVDRLIYLDREAMNEAARFGNRNISKFCNACFTGEYPTPDVTLDRLRKIEAEREGRRDNVPV